MQSLKTARSIAILLAISATLCVAQTQKTDEWKEVETVLGRQGKPQPDGTLKFGMPRTDLKVTVDGVSIKPALALGSWIAFAGSPEKAMVMRDLVLTEDESPRNFKHPFSQPPGYNRVSPTYEAER